MITLRKLALSVLFSVIVLPAWSTIYTIPGTSSTVDIRNQSNDPSLQFTLAEINSMLTTLSLFPPGIRNLVQYIEANPAQTGGVDTDQKHGIIINFTTPSELPFETLFFQVGVGLLTYYNISAADQKAWKALPDRSGNPAADFAGFVSAWYNTSYGALSTLSFARLKATGDGSEIASELYMALSFADPTTGTIRTYCEDNSIEMTTCPQRTFSDDPFTWNANGISFGGYTFLLDGNNQLIGVQQGTDPVVYLSTPLAAVPPSVIAEFTPSPDTVQISGGRNIKIVEPASQNYQFVPQEIAQIRALLSQLPADQFPQLQSIQAVPMISKPPNLVLPPGQFCVSPNAAQITCYLNISTVRQIAPLNMNAQLSQLIGGNLYQNVMSDSAQQEWNSFWTWDLSGGAQYSFTVYYQEWVGDAVGTLSQAVNAAINGNGLPLQVVLFVSSFFDSGSNTLQCGSIGLKNLYAPQTMALTWVDNTITLGNTIFQVQQDQNPDDATFGQYQIISIQQAGQDPVDFSQNPITLPNTFVTAVPQVVTTPPSISSPGKKLGGRSIKPVTLINPQETVTSKELPSTYDAMTSEKGMQKRFALDQMLHGSNPQKPVLMMNPDTNPHPIDSAVITVPSN